MGKKDMFANYEIWLVDGYYVIRDIFGGEKVVPKYLVDSTDTNPWAAFVRRFLEERTLSPSAAQEYACRSLLKRKL